MVNASVLRDVDCALGMHLWGPVRYDQFTLREGPMMASPGSFVIKIIGAGGHGSAPQDAINPIPIAASAIQAINSALQNKLGPFEDYVVSFCAIQGGTKYNIIPDEVTIEGTVRIFEAELGRKIARVMEDCLEGAVRSFGGRYEMRYTDEGIPPVKNDAALTALVKCAAERMVGPQRVELMSKPDMGAEDFAVYSQLVPSCFFFAGIAEDMNNPPMNHSSRFAWNDDVLMSSMQVMSMAAVDILNSY